MDTINPSDTAESVAASDDAGWDPAVTAAIDAAYAAGRKAAVEDEVREQARQAFDDSSRRIAAAGAQYIGWDAGADYLAAREKLLAVIDERHADNPRVRDALHLFRAAIHLVGRGGDLGGDELAFADAALDVLALEHFETLAEDLQNARRDRRNRAANETEAMERQVRASLKKPD